MVAPLSTDPDEAQAAALLRRLLQERGFTHQSFAEEVSVSPGRVSQWATNRGGVPPERAAEVARHLQTSPESISVSWRRLRDQFLESQLSRLTGATILRAIQLMHDTNRKLRHPLGSPQSDPELFAEMLRLAILENGEEGNVERSLGKPVGPRSGTVGAARKTKAGDAPRAAPRRHRNTG